MDKSKLPLLFACSGCSNAGATADQIARRLSREECAEMSCLAGVGAGKSHFLKKLDGREIWVIDGCPLQCGRGIFEQLELPFCANVRFVGLHEAGLRKHAQPAKGREFDLLVTFVKSKPTK